MPSSNWFWKLNRFTVLEVAERFGLPNDWMIWQLPEAQSHRQARHRHDQGERRPLEATEPNYQLDYPAISTAEARNENGEGNNETNTEWGSAGKLGSRSTACSTRQVGGTAGLTASHVVQVVGITAAEPI